MMRIKRLTTFILCFVLLFAVGCGRGTGNSGGTDTPNIPTVDTVAPTVALGDMAETMIIGDSLTVSYTVSDNVSTADNIYIEIKILNGDGINVTAQVYTASTKTFAPQAAGEYRIIVEAYDEAGNSAQAQHKVVVTEATQNPDDTNMITALTLGNTTNASYAGVRTKWYAAASVKDNGKAEITARLLRGNTYKYATEVANGIDGDVFIAATSGVHWLEVTASYKGYTLTDYMQIDIEILGNTNELYSFGWAHTATLDYTAFAVGYKYVKFIKSDNVPVLTYEFGGDVSDSYTLDLAVSGLTPDSGKNTSSHAPMFSASVLTGNNREDVFSVQVNGNNPNGKYIATDFKEGGGSFMESHYNEYTITENLMEDNSLTIARYGKNYTVKLNGAVKAERIADTTESKVTGVAFSTTGAIGEVTDILLVKDEDPDIAIAEYTMPEKPTYIDGSVHDPSIFKDPVSEKYYAFGSHFAVYESEDLKVWTDAGTGAAKLYGRSDWTNVLSKAYAYVSAGVNNWNQNTWAPDVEYYNGKYYMYFSLTSQFGSSKSFIGRVESDSVTGPYSNEVEIVKSAGNDGGPNAIDPELFYDKNGELWMVYGSFFGGIYQKKLYNSGANWGLPMSEEDYPDNGLNSGYGKRLWIGGGGPEGPYVFYNAETDYYYLMVSYGDLNNDYNMRVARSKTPNGPYLDIVGNDMATTGAGNKIAGNYQFADETTGYAALGHNSVLVEDGKYYCVFHTRYRSGTTGVSSNHNLRVHQIFFNEAGWPVMSPARYAGEELGKVTLSTGYGNYDVIVHTSGTSKVFAESTRYTFDQDGTIRIGETNYGTWEIKENYYINITLNGVEYKGVIAPSWCVYRNKAVLTITATSSAGVPLWANHT